MDLGLRGLNALVTGASRGIGFAIAEHLALEGVNVSICGRTQDQLDIAVKQLRTHGTTIHSEVLDTADHDAVKTWTDNSAKEFGGIDIVISNVSGMIVSGEAGWRQNFEIDLLGYVGLVEAALPYLELSKAGSIVALGSTAAVETFGDPAGPYGAFKAAMIQHTSGLAQNLAPKGIRCNTISPGPVFFEGGSWERVKTGNPAFYEKTLAQIARGSFGTAEEVARVVTFIASPAASYLTGENIVVDGGFTKKVKF